MALDLADHAYLLETGRVVMLSGTADDIKQRRRGPPLVPRLLTGTPTWNAFIHQVLCRHSPPAASTPSVALALVMIYQATHHVNFAQGEMAMFSTYIAWTLIQTGMPYWAAFFITVAISFVDRRRHRARSSCSRVGEAPVLAVVVVFIGLLVIFNSVAGWIFTYTDQALPRRPSARARCVGSDLVSPHELGSIGDHARGAACCSCFFRFTRVGPRDARGARIRCPADWSASGWAGCWRSAGASPLRSARIAGMMVAPVVFLDPNMMAGILLYAFAGALVGGIDNPLGAVHRRLHRRRARERAAAPIVIGNELKLSVALVLIVGVLVVQPSGPVRQSHRDAGVRTEQLQSSCIRPIRLPSSPRRRIRREPLL
jgi:branched-chain amino acid transport system permease protein